MNLSTAELATGVIVVCIPTLPAILQHRTKRPPMSILNSSTKSRSLTSNVRYGPGSVARDSTLLGGEYIELGEGQPRAPDVSPPRKMAVNKITECEDDKPSTCDISATSTCSPPPGRILKIVEIEQSNA